MIPSWDQVGTPAGFDDFAHFVEVYLSVVDLIRDPADSVVARIVTLVAEASATKARTQLFIEKVEQRYSVVMVAATLALFIVPQMLGEDLRSALLRAMTFMIVASPCALVLATMPPLLSAIATAGRHGVLVKSAVAMEHLATVDTVAFDKTGPLTTGTPRVVYSRRRSTMESTAAGSRPEKGSSRTRNSGSPMTAAAIWTRC